ncbi:hypothetical protein FB451DRAFT_298393 [Mycena latifolia]|nr:hypothetical protein FB451DRAFT_298393 [Mycena latifolia]
MDDEPQVQAEFQSESTVEGSSPPRDQFTGAFFPQSQNLTVTGGQFRSITNVHHAASSLPSDFRMIPLGDLDLRNEICLDSGVVYRRWNSMRSVRCMYSARIHGSKSPMTVTLYQGENAEEEWHHDVSRYSYLRHPNILQLFGTVNSCGIHATIFQDELILAKQILKKYSDSHFSAVYVWWRLDTEFEDAKQYTRAVSGKYPNSCECTIWIRPSTGRLCVDFTLPGNDPLMLWWPARVDSPSLLVGSGLEPPEDWKIIDSISLAQYHQICFYHFRHVRMFSISTNALVHLGAIIYCPHGSEIQGSEEIGFIPELIFFNLGWCTAEGKPLWVMESGWTVCFCIHPIFMVD